jgi:hypothetical protein
MKKLNLIEMAAMPAAASENQLGKLFGVRISEPQMQREARGYWQALGGPKGVERKLGTDRKIKNEWSQNAGRKLTGSAVRKDCVLKVKHGTAHWNRQVEGTSP